MKKAYIFILGLATLFFGFINKADKKVLKELGGQSYHPIVKGMKSTYVANFNTYTISFDTNVTVINQIEYLKQTTDLNGSLSFVYYREHEGNISYLKPDQTKETIEIPKELKVGFVWYESDSSWKYTLINLNENFQTPVSIFENCLLIQAENMNKNKSDGYYQLYLQYFQRGRGYVGSKVGGFTYSYLMANE